MKLIFDSMRKRGRIMMRKGKRFLVLLTAATLSVNMLGISAFAAEDTPETDTDFVVEIPENETDLYRNSPDSDVPEDTEISYEPIIIDIPDGPIPAGENWDNDGSVVDIPTTDSLKDSTADHSNTGILETGDSSALWMTVGVFSGTGVIFTVMRQKSSQTK